MRFMNLLSRGRLEEATEAERFAERICSIHEQLKEKPNLLPCKEVNDLFQELVGMCIQILPAEVTQQILENPTLLKIIPSLQAFCATAECHLEGYWADFITSGADEIDAKERLEKFPYHLNYIDLTRMELCAMNAVNATRPKKIVFIGSGPLPLSSICLVEALKKTGGQILNIDRNDKAIIQSTALCEKLGYDSSKMDFIVGDAGSLTYSLEDYDVVYMAALVGSSQSEKEKLLLEVTEKMREGSLLLVRSAHGLRTLLYPEFHTTSRTVLSALEICMAVHPYTDVVNSVIVGRVKRKEKV